MELESADRRWFGAFAPSDIEERIAKTVQPTARLRILNPFDPVIRDRARLSRLFGFDYRIEIFVPAAQRKWGYYVYPLLEGDRFVGRIELKADRKAGELKVIQLWSEPGIKWTDEAFRKSWMRNSAGCRGSSVRRTSNMVLRSAGLSRAKTD